MTQRPVYRGSFFDVTCEDVTLPDGRQLSLDIVRHPGAAAVVPFLSEDEVLLIRQYRAAVGCVIWEVPAGKLDPGEAPAECAMRELEEETGQRAGRLEALGDLLTTPGFTDERIHLFSAHDLQASTQKLDADEVIELVPMPLDGALELIWSGEMNDGKSALALLRAAHRLGKLP
jgi:ADP-ribose pyrophosphatase